MKLTAVQRDPATIRVATLNLWGQGGDWPARRSALVAGFRDLDADLVAFQEAVVTDGFDQVVDVLGSGVNVLHHRLRGADGSGISIASRWPFSRSDELDLHVSPRVGEFPAATLAAEVVVPGPIGPVAFVNHLPSWQLAFEHERQLQAVAASRFIDDFVGRGEMHVILAGDLDADPDASSIRFWTGHEALAGTSVCYRDTWESLHPGEPGHTFTPRNPLTSDAARDWPFRRIDYVFVRCGEHAGATLEIVSCELLFDRPVEGVWASDHFGVVAELGPSNAATSTSSRT